MDEDNRVQTTTAKGVQKKRKSDGTSRLAQPVQPTQPSSLTDLVLRGYRAQLMTGRDASQICRATRRMNGADQVLDREISGTEALRTRNAPRGANLDTMVQLEAGRTGIDPLLVYAIVGQESGGSRIALSPKGAAGVMQLMPGTARRFGVRDRYDLAQAVRGGVDYFVWLLDRFGGNVALALAGYNAGEMSVEAYLLGNPSYSVSGKVINRSRVRTLGIPPYRETQDYVERISVRYMFLRDACNGLARVKR